MSSGMRRDPRARRATRIRSRGGESGTAAVEFALVLPLVLTIALALVQIGLVLRDRLLVESAARAGARTAAIVDDQAAVASAVQGAAPDLDPAALQVSIVRTGARGEPVTVTVGYVSEVRVPLVGWLFGGSVSMSAGATDRQEFG
jgi:Flp pilus assembly protein TadG